MKLTDMQKKSESELLKHADKLRTKINAKRLSIATTEDKKVREIRTLRKELARALTIANQNRNNHEEKAK